MFFSEIATVDNAQYVADALAHIASNPGSTFELQLVRSRHTSGTTPPTQEQLTYWVSVDSSREPSVVTLANGSSVVHCITEDGTPIDLLFGPPAVWRVSYAVALIGDQPR